MKPNYKKALVVVDMQNDFIDGAIGSKEAAAVVPGVIEKIKNFDGAIYYTMDTHHENYLHTQEGKKLPVPHCIRDTHGWQINDGVMDALNEAKSTRNGTGVVCFEKNRFGMVDIGININTIANISGYNLESIEFVGLCTDICVVSNALIAKATLPEVQIIVDSSCCAGVTKESHDAALLTMKMCQVDVVGE